MKRMWILVVLLVVPPLAVFPQYDPPPGGDDIYELVSPLFLGGGFTVTSEEGPVANLMNPAASGRTQRVTLDAGYIGLTGFGDRADNAGWQGHAAEIGATIPSPVGVFSGLVHFLGSDLDAMKLGSSFLAHTSFSKDLYDDLSFGTGVNFRVGGAAAIDTGVTADLGILYTPGDMGVARDFRLGISMLGMGLPYTPVDGQSSAPPVFTPAAGTQFAPIRTEDVELVVQNAVSAPSFQNVRMNIGATLNIADRVSVFSGVRADARRLWDGGSADRSLIPSVGISVDFSPDFSSRTDDDNFIADRGWNRGEVRSRIAAAPMYDNVWAFGTGINAPLGVLDRDPPEISVEYEETEYISPNSDGVADALKLPISIDDDRYVTGYTLTIRNEDGEVVRRIENKEDRPENRDFENIVERLLAVKTGVPIPETLRWGGTSDSGSVVPDGRYEFALSAVDDNGNEGRSETHDVVVDTTPPEISVEKPTPDGRIFSPDGDGNKDELTIRQEGSREDEWHARIEDMGEQTVRTWTWEEQAVDDLTWDGRNDDGEVVPDGVYRYVVESTDRAGNRNREELQNIIVDTRPTEVDLTIGDSHFSPNDDGVKDTLHLHPDVEVQENIVGWRLEVVAARNDEVVREFTGRSVPPQRIRFDGTDDEEERLAEDTYYARLQVEYRHGSRPQAESPEFVLDVTPPRATVRTDYDIFSPNGDGNKDIITFFQDSSREQLWEGRISDAEGEVVRTFTFRETADMRTSWDGRSADGRLADDGEYTYVLEATDRAGNTGRSDPVRFTLDTEEAEVLLSAEYRAFSPNANGTRDQIQLFPQVQRNEDVAEYELSVETIADERRVYRTEGSGPIEDAFAWDGFDEEGRRAPDADYRARLSVTYTNGFETEARTSPFTLDTAPPRISLDTEYRLFSPDGDGNRDELRIEQDGSDEELWEGAIVDDDGGEVKTWTWKGEPEPFVWDGRDEAGNRVDDGRYRYVVGASDTAGNEAEAEISGITVDTRPTPTFATVDVTGFAPNDDGHLDTATMTLYTNLTEGVESWRFDILDETGTAVRTFEGESVDPAMEIEWDGTDEDGNITEGEYTGRYEVRYRKGNRPVAETTRFRLDVSPPEIDVDLDPVPFSPDNDGVDDELSIRISVEDESDIARWRFRIFDRNDNYFTEFAGEGRPAEEIIWDGRSDDGELVISAEDYPYELRVSDALGNTARTEGEIPVDVLVVRDGDRLRVQIASITFEPNSPELVTERTSERGAKNAAVLERLVEVFTKYDDYRIRIEGHAVNITGTEREEREELDPLSEARAESVKEALVERGLAEDRISTLGRGGTEPLVPHDDEENRWKNRRVEFILIR